MSGRACEPAVAGSASGGSSNGLASACEPACFATSKGMKRSAAPRADGPRRSTRPSEAPDPAEAPSGRSWDPPPARIWDPPADGSCGTRRTPLLRGHLHEGPQSDSHSL